jgi:2'-5' RNA ligase
MPAGDVRERLSHIILRLAGRYGAPQFAPHVTLLGSCAGPLRELVIRTGRVAAAIRPFAIRLGQLDYLDEYYRCLFVHAQLTEPLRIAHLKASHVLGGGRQPVFMPHLSLLYGSFPRSLKEELVSELGPRLDVEFKVRSLHLYRTRGEPARWRRAASFGLK